MGILPVFLPKPCCSCFFLSICCPVFISPVVMFEASAACRVPLSGVLSLYWAAVFLLTAGKGSENREKWGVVPTLQMGNLSTKSAASLPVVRAEGKPANTRADSPHGLCAQKAGLMTCSEPSPLCLIYLNFSNALKVFLWSLQGLVVHAVRNIAVALGVVLFDL